MYHRIELAKVGGAKGLLAHLTKIAPCERVVFLLPSGAGSAVIASSACDVVRAAIEADRLNRQRVVKRGIAQSRKADDGSWGGARRVARRIRGAAKVTAEQKEDIRRRRGAGESRQDLAREYGLKPATISTICKKT